jgi:hypothetical protein
MKLKLPRWLFILAAVLLTIQPSLQTFAKTEEFESMSLELSIPEDTIVLTKDTPDTDELWSKAGIIDPKTEKGTFDDMGVKAILYDPNTKTLVRLMQKTSKDSRDIYNLSLLSEEELNSFFDKLTKTDSEDTSTKTSIEKYAPSEAAMPFFRFTIELTQDNIPITEIIYGTIINGSMTAFDIYEENSTEPVDETFVKNLVSGTRFTKIMDKEEAKKLETQYLIRSVVMLAVFIAAIVVCIILLKKNSKKKLVLKKTKGEELTKFYAEQKRKEEQNIKDKVIFINRTLYDQDIIKSYFIYNEIYKKIKYWVLTAVILAGFIFLNFSGYSLVLCVIVVSLLLFILIYLNGIRIEKLVTQTIKSFDTKKGTHAIFTFYDNYLTLSGIQYISQYPYTQITELKEYKNYIFIYFGPDKAVYLSKEGFENTDEFMNFIKGKIK